MQAASGRDDQIKELPKFSFFPKKRPGRTHICEMAFSHTAVFAGIRQGEAVQQHCSCGCRKKARGRDTAARESDQKRRLKEQQLKKHPHLFSHVLMKILSLITGA